MNFFLLLHNCHISYKCLYIHSSLLIAFIRLCSWHSFVLAHCIHPSLLIAFICPCSLHSYVLAYCIYDYSLIHPSLIKWTFIVILSDPPFKEASFIHYGTLIPLTSSIMWKKENDVLLTWKVLILLISLLFRKEEIHLKDNI